MMVELKRAFAGHRTFRLGPGQTDGSDGREREFARVFERGRRDGALGFIQRSSGGWLLVRYADDGDSYDVSSCDAQTFATPGEIVAHLTRDPAAP